LNPKCLNTDILFSGNPNPTNPTTTYYWKYDTLKDYPLILILTPHEEVKSMM